MFCVNRKIPDNITLSVLTNSYGTEVFKSFVLASHVEDETARIINGIFYGRTCYKIDNISRRIRGLIKRSCISILIPERMDVH